MSTLSHGPLAALIHYYHQLKADSALTVADFGFRRKAIHLQVVLEPDGTLVGIESLRRTNDATGRPVRLLVPDAGGRSGLRLTPCFCWDNTAYALGRDIRRKPERTAAMFAAFRDLHLTMLGDLRHDLGFVALCRFLEHWAPLRLESLPCWREQAELNVVFTLRGTGGYIHESTAVREAWLRRLAEQGKDQGVAGYSLITGEREPIARLHPLIHGVAGTYSSGAAIVSFNADAFTSYSKTQGYNAPVGVGDAFRYTTALNHLLASEYHRMRIGGVTIVFWIDQPAAKEAEELLAAWLGTEHSKAGGSPVRNAAGRVKAPTNAAGPHGHKDPVGVCQARFNVLGLAPKASRIQVCFWLSGKVDQLAEQLSQHYAHLKIAGATADGPTLTLSGLLHGTAREPACISPPLAGAVARAVLVGRLYPATMLSTVIQRIRFDARVTRCRAAILKAYLTRNSRKEVPIELSRNYPDAAYQLGRLLAVLKKTQEQAVSTALKVITEHRYIGPANARPSALFPHLLRSCQHHMCHLDVNVREARKQLIDEIRGRVVTLPSHLSLERQGLMYVAYYHQCRQLTIGTRTRVLGVEQ